MLKVVKSYAKINLGLKIINQRKDLFHNIESVFVEIDLYDELIFSKSDKFELKYKNKNLNIIKSENSISKAYNLLNNLYKFNQHHEIILNKKIPLKSGLAGGSSNAAHTIKTLNKLNSLNLSIKEMHDISLQIGSDVPFFITGGQKHITGRGDIINPSPFILKKDLLLLLIFPPFSVSTKTAYENIKKYLESNNKRPKFASLNADVDWKLLENDFEKFVGLAYPEIMDVKQSMYDDGALYSGLSGSGSTMFGVYNNKQFLLKTKKKLNNYKTLIASPV